ncbi:phage portal protein [Oscillatoria laete-virens NRMC-F 0139]|nr:phage portal protein [Oscillatoria laete-virens]MDL5053348.1 phage portal protein [Oscillatoria laete-virens NRMC-F 0139]
MQVRARYDAALTSDNNRRHWFNADGLSANAANSPQVRRTLRNRTRYEVANNSYARGIVLTLANDTIGTGPRLQMLTGVNEVNLQIERAFADWATVVRLPEKLRTLRMAKAEDGEGFAVLFNNRSLPTLVQLDLKLVEADQVTTPSIQNGARNAVDGIVFDAQGNPNEYHLLKQHPGETGSASSQQFDRVPADSVIHYFRVDRPGQARGIPELTAALPLFALLRDYTIATLDAAKAAANVSGVLYTDAPANGESADVEPLDSIALERNTLLTMPGGWKMGQVRAEQPTSTFAEFKREILNEIARCLSMPFNIAAGNSSGYNYASGRLDHQTYFKMIRVEQSHLAVTVLDRIFRAWLYEASRVDGLLPIATRRDDFIPSHQWFWDGFEHVDPNKEANAQATRLQNNTTTLAEEYAKKGRDWETELRQRAKEIALIRTLGLSNEESQTTPPTPPTQEKTEETPDESNVTD